MKGNPARSIFIGQNASAGSEERTKGQTVPQHLRVGHNEVWPEEKSEERTVSRSARGLRRSTAVTVPPQNELHLIFQLQLAFLEGGFFELFGF